jgi:hypothetical protein
MYVTGENKDTVGATRYEFTYNNSLFLTRRDRYNGGRLTERFLVNYDRNSLIENVILQSAGSSDTFFYRYDFTGMRMEVRRTSADRRSGMTRIYNYTDPPADRDFLYPRSTLGRLESITDSLFENGQYTRKLRSAFYYSMSNRDLTDIFQQRIESFPGAPNSSTLTGAYKTTLSSYKNPFAFISPDFYELPDELATPWPFIRKGAVVSYQLFAPSMVTPELDTYELAKSENRFGTAEQVRKTMTGRRSGQITVQYFFFVFKAL